MTKRRNFSDKFKATVALEALRGDKTVQEIASKRQLHPTQVSTWKRQAIDGMVNVFSDKVKKAENKDGEIKELHAKIGQLAVENDFLSQGAEAMSLSERREMIRKDNTDLSLTRQCKLLKISRSSIYYTPVGFDQATIDLMHEIDRIFTKYPFFGSRQIAAYLPQSGFSAGRHRVRRLMGIMGLQAIYKGPNTSKKHPQHKIWPYLLRKLSITRPNHVWCSDITYIPVKNGFLYLVAIMDWATRKVLSWRLSNTLDASFCVEALDEAIAKYGKPEIMNTDQGSQYTGADWIKTLTKADIKISMDGRGRYLDNIFIERLWRSLKQEAVYLHEITNGFQAKRIIDDWIGFYNAERPHTALDKRTPDAAYFEQSETRKAA
ncbi:IS3 family transposase [Roseobacter sp. MED193]|uniref:IS3 family transposase n=2 Tax=Rhodobacterales TaxID=204455 RepID=UPI000A2F3111|nr:IS3 family transposase [Roseobacter sp. MED193]